LLNCMGEIGYLACVAGERKNVQAGVGAIGRIDVSSIVDFHVVGLNGNLAMLLGAPAYAALVGLIGNGWDVIADFFGLERIAHVDGAHAGIEKRQEQDAVVINRRHTLV